MRVKLDGQALAEVISVLDTVGNESISLEGLFEAALSEVEQKKVSAFWAAILCDACCPSQVAGKITLPQVHQGIRQDTRNIVTSYHGPSDTV